MSDNHIEDFLAELQFNKNLSETTIMQYRKYLIELNAFVTCDIELSTRNMVIDFCGKHAHKTMKLSPTSRRPLISAVRGFFGWLSRSGIIKKSPAYDLHYPKVGKKLPESFGLENAEKILMQPDLATFIGIRDLAILSVLIGCGARVSGVVGLNESSLIWGNNNDLAMKLNEKGGKERIVPVPNDTCWILRAYLGHEYLVGIDRTIGAYDNVLFVSTVNNRVLEADYFGEARRLSARSIDQMIKCYGRAAGISEIKLHAHSMRHLFGTELAESDVDILTSQALMGHASSDTSKIYVHLAWRRLREAMQGASPIDKINNPAKGIG